MTVHLQRDLDSIRRQLMEVGALVEEATNKAITALIDRRTELVDGVIEGDSLIDEKEVQVEEACLKALALHQPVAIDLRYIVVVMKVNNDLERMGDLASNIAARAAYLSTHEPLDLPIDVRKMAKTVQSMLHDSLDALVRSDTTLARGVLRADDLVDDFLKQMFDGMQRTMVEDSSTVKRAVHYLSAARHLERIADLATNIAEDVIYMSDGEVIRHGLSNSVGSETD